MTADQERIAVIRKMIRESYLALPPEEEEQLAREIEGLLENVEILARLEVEEGPPRTALEPAELRPDEVAPSLPPDLALSNAPASHDGYVSVPKVLGAGKKDGKS
jgi:aspartyl-tRNA(Asn)/glutamyl-tRNA(Gln) amidotransferase subunit C